MPFLACFFLFGFLVFFYFLGDLAFPFFNRGYPFGFMHALTDFVLGFFGGEICRGFRDILAVHILPQQANDVIA